MENTTTWESLRGDSLKSCTRFERDSYQNEKSLPKTNLFYRSRSMRKTVNIPDRLIEYANTKDIDEMLRILWDFVRYKITWEIECKELLDLFDPNLSRSEKMRGNKNSVKQTKKQSETVKKTEWNSQQKQSETVKNTNCFTLKIADTNWLNQTHEESWGFIYSNSILLNIVTWYIDNNITYTSINYQINKQWKEKYIESQIEEAEKLIKKIWFQNFQLILQYLPHDDFWSKNILSIAKLNKKNKEWVPYYAVIMDRIKSYTPKVVSIPTV